MKFITIFVFIFNLHCFSQRIEEDKITIAIGSEPASLDPLYAPDLVSQGISRLIYSRLFSEKNGKNDELVEKVEKISDKTYKLFLKQNKLSNIHGLDSYDAEFCLNRLITENHPAKSSYSFIESAKAESREVLILKLREDFPDWKEIFSHPKTSIYLKKEYLEKKNFVSSGVYELKDWNRNNYILLKKNYKSKNYPQNLEFKIIPQSQTAMYLFVRGKVDLFKSPFFLLENRNLKNVRLVTKPGRSVQYLAINNNEKCFDLNFRKALNYAVDKKIVIEKLFSNRAEEVYASVPVSYYQSTFEKLNDNLEYVYNIAKAKEFISKSSCYPEILNREIELRMRADDENKTKGAVLVSFFKAIGLKVKLIPLEKAKLYKENSEKKGDLTLLTWYLDTDSVFNYIDPLFSRDRKGNGGNRSFYSGERVNSLIEKIRKEYSEEKKLQFAKEAIFEIYQDAPWVFLWSQKEDYYLSERANQYEGLKENLF